MQTAGWADAAVFAPNAGRAAAHEAFGDFGGMPRCQLDAIRKYADEAFGAFAGMRRFPPAGRGQGAL